MADLNALDLNDEGISDSDFENMPETVGGNRIPPQPGIYRFALPPASALEKCFDIMVTSDQGQKLVAIFDGVSALRNITLGEYYSVRVNNRTRMMKNKGGEVVISDMGMLLKVVGARPTPDANGVITNRAYGQALAGSGSKEFMAEHGLTANCNKARDIYKDGAIQKGEKGCGQRYALKGYPGKNGKPDTLTIPKELNESGHETTRTATRFKCKCGAELQCFNELRAFRPVS